MFMNRGLLAGVYSLTALLGLATMFFPSESIWGLVGLHITWLYGGLLLIGAVGALVSIILPNYKLEMTFLWFVAGGYLIYDIALWGLFAERIGIIDGLAPPYGPAIAVAVLTIFLFAKILLLAKKSNELVRASENGLD